MKKRKLKPHFEPDMGKRAHCANVNVDILGKIIEIVTDLTLIDVYKQFIFDPLGLKNTYLPIDEDDFVPNVKDTSFYLPKMIRSIRAGGGCISMARDLIIRLFLEEGCLIKLFFMNWKSTTNCKPPCPPFITVPDI